MPAVSCKYLLASRNSWESLTDYLNSHPPIYQSHTGSLTNLQTPAVWPGQIPGRTTTTCSLALSGCSNALSVLAMAEARLTRLLQILWSTFDSIFSDQAGVIRDEAFA